MMKKFLPAFLLACLGSVQATYANTNYWQATEARAIPAGIKMKLHPNAYKVFALSTDAMKAKLLSIASGDAQVIALPMADGYLKNFRVSLDGTMSTELMAKYPDIRTFTAQSVDGRKMTAKLDITLFGFHAMIFDGTVTSFIDPYSNTNSGYYIAYYRKDYPQQEGNNTMCQVEGDDHELTAGAMQIGAGNGTPINPEPLTVSGVIKRSYRLALACTFEYANAVTANNPTKGLVLSAMVTSVNRVNGVYEREVGVTMQLIGNTDTLIYTTAADPYTNSSGGIMLSENQNNVNTIIGSGNYDMGHVFSTGGGGIAQLGCICDANRKAMGVTGRTNPVGDPFDIDYVAHEMGHQFGANHTFNANTGSCDGNGSSNNAYEPGSGTTIMAYAGICGGSNNTQNFSDPYFHSRSLDVISTFINGNGGTCAIALPSGNIPPTVPTFTQTYNIPFRTPFELTAPQALDVDHDELTYCWEQNDLGSFRSDFATTRKTGPIFRSFKPDTSRTRIFPQLSRIINNVSSYLGEKLPDTDRVLSFRLTVRDILNGSGTFNFPTDKITLNVVHTVIPFAVTYPNTTAEYWQAAATANVLWNIASTDVAPINCTNVDIFLSTDNGMTYPYVLATGVPNTGTATVTVPNIITDSARVKVKGAGNVFFDISNQRFSIGAVPNAIGTVAKANDGVQVYPVPTSGMLHIALTKAGSMQAVIINTVGQQVAKFDVTGDTQVNVSGWAKGVYNIKLKDATGVELTKRFVVQ